MKAGAEKKKEKQTGQHNADKSQFLSDYGQDEISVGFGQIEEFLLSRSQALSEKTARAYRYPSLNELISRIKGIDPGIEESLPPSAPVRDEVNELIESKGGKGGHEKEITARDPGSRQHDEHEDHEHEGSAEVRLFEQQGAEYGAKDYEGPEAYARFLDAVLFLDQRGAQE